MNRHIVRFAALGMLACASLSQAAEEICLSSGDKGCRRNPLSHVPFKAVIIEMIDEQVRSDVGISTSRLMQRELLSLGIHDMEKRGILRVTDVASRLGGDPGLDKTLNELAEWLHPKALEIAEFLDTQFVAWGAVIVDGHEITLYSFLTILPAYWQQAMGVRLYSGSGGVSDIVAPLSVSNLNFDPTLYDRRSLFAGRIRARCGDNSSCPVRSSPDDESATSGQVSTDASMTFSDMHGGKWLEIGHRDGRPAFLDIDHALVAPPAVHATNKRDYRGWACPDKKGVDYLEKGALPEKPHEVIDIVMIDHRDIPCYKILTDAGERWFPEWELEPLYRFPILHFLAGLYRYAAAHFARAESELGHYIARGHNRVTKAAAWQLIAAMRAERVKSGDQEQTDPFTPLDHALRLTPNDPAIYNLRALIELFRMGDVDRALVDLGRAVELDPYNRATRVLLRNLIDTWTTAPDVFRSGNVALDDAQVQRLSELYGRMEQI